MFAKHNVYTIFVHVIFYVISFSQTATTVCRNVMLRKSIVFFRNFTN